jgi:hypothetical protein
VSTIWIAAAVVAIIVLRRISPVAGSIFAMVVVLVLGGWGYYAYHHGGGIGLVFAERQLPQALFYVIIAVWFALEAYGLMRQLRRRPQRTQSDSQE